MKKPADAINFQQLPSPASLPPMGFPPLLARAKGASFPPLRAWLFLIILALLTCTGSGYAADGNRSQKRTPPRTVQGNDRQKTMNRLHQGIKEKEADINLSRKTESHLLADLEGLETHLQSSQKKLQEHTEQLHKKQAVIQEQQGILDHVLAEKKQAQEHLEKRLAAFYRMGAINVMNVICSTTTLPMLLDFEERFHYVLQYDLNLISGYREKIALLSQTRKTLNQEKEQLLTVITDVNRQKQDLDATKQEKMNLLSKVDTEKKLYQRALQEMEAAALDLTATLKRLEEKKKQEKLAAAIKSNPPKQMQEPAAQDFAGWKGRLEPPVRGTVLTYFGPNNKVKFGLSTSENGIDIKTEKDAPIKAVFKGVISYAGNLKGYGQIMIIDHGDQYYSLVSRAAELYKKTGDEVQRGEIIGIIRNPRGLLGEGLHFEIRHGSEPINPLHWLDNTKLKINARGDVK